MDAVEPIGREASYGLSPLFPQWSFNFNLKVAGSEGYSQGWSWYEKCVPPLSCHTKPDLPKGNLIGKPAAKMKLDVYAKPTESSKDKKSCLHIGLTSISFGFYLNLFELLKAHLMITLIYVF